MRASFFEQVEYKCQVVVEEINFDTQVLLVNLRPLRRVTIATIAQTAAAPIGAIAAATTNLRKIGKAAVGRRVTYGTVRIAELQERDVFRQWFPPLLIRRNPANCHCWEETETMPRLKVLRTSIAGIQLHEVTVGEIVGSTSRQTLLFVGQCLQKVAIVGIQITAFVEQQQS